MVGGEVKEPGRAFVIGAFVKRIFLSCLLAAATASAGCAGLHGNSRIRSLSLRADQLMREGRYAEASALGEEAARGVAARYGERHPAVAEWLGFVGDARLEGGDLAAAESSFERSVAILDKRAAAPRWSAALARALTGLGYLRLRDGRFEEAESLLRRALALREAAFGGEDARVGESLTALADALSDRWKSKEAEAAYRRALAIFERRPTPEDSRLVQALGGLGRLYSRQGDRARAAPLWERAAAAADRIYKPDDGGLVVPWLDLAALRLLQGRPREAEALYRRALALAERTWGPEDSVSADILHKLARLYQYHLPEKLSEAEPLYRRSLAAQERNFGPGHPSAGGALTDLALLQDGLGKPRDAAATMEQAAAAMRRQVAGESAEQEWKAGDFTPDLHSVRVLFWLAVLRSRTARDPASWRSVESAAVLGWDLLERVRSGLKPGAHAPVPGGAGAADQMAAVAEYGKILTFASWAARELARLEPGRADADRRRVFSYMERGKARDLLDLISAARLKRLAGIPASFLEREASLDAALSESRNSVVEAKGEGRWKAAAALSEASAARQAEREKFLEEARLLYPDYHALRHPSPASLDAIQSALKPGEALVEYAVSGGKIVAFVAGRKPEQTASVELAISIVGLERLVRRAADPLLEARLDDLKPGTLSELYRSVFAPVERAWSAWPAADKPKVVHLVRFGALHYVPFEMFVTGWRKAAPRSALLYADWRNYDYLAGRYAFAYWQSGTLLYMARKHSTPIKAEEPLLAFADPVFSPLDREVDAKEARKAIRHDRGLGGLVAFASGGSRGRTRSFPLDRLQTSGAEAAAAGKALGLEPEGDWLRLREEATEGRLNGQDLTRYRYFLFSTHGLQPSDVKRLAAAAGRRAGEPVKDAAFAQALAGKVEGLREPLIALTLAPGESDENDGLLTMGELFGLKLDAEAVILSACVTGLGEPVAGEGLVGLTRALFYAGARTALVSLWYVNDESTGLLVARALAEAGMRKKGEPLSAAVNRARLALMREGEGKSLGGTEVAFAHPIFWAPFVLYGDWAEN